MLRTQRTSQRSNYVTNAQLTTINNTSGVNSGDQTITLTGDVTGTGTGTFATTIASDAVASAEIANGTVAYGDIQDVTDNKLLGRSAGSNGPIQELTIGTGLSLSGGTLSATNGGTVTSVSVSSANGVSGSVTNPTTTPAISLTLGDITSTSVSTGSLTATRKVVVGYGGAIQITGNAATINSDNYSAVELTEDNDATNDNITISGTPTNGQLLYIFYNHTSGGDDIVFVGGYTITVLNNRSFGLTMCYINGGWRVVGGYQY